MSSTDEGVGGNSMTPSNMTEVDTSEKKQTSPSVHWVFTWNNYPENWFEILSSNDDSISGYVYGKEIGEECGTPHLNCYVRFHKKTRPSSLEWPPGIFATLRWFKFGRRDGKNMKRDIARQIEYCRKGLDSVSRGVPEEVRVLPIADMLPWQRAVLRRLDTRADNTTVVWFWENDGSIGKTQLQKYLVRWHNAILTGGRTHDMKMLVCEHYKLHGEWPKICMLNVSRTAWHKVSYDGIEEIKDGLFAATKFECSMVHMNPPHMFVFANAPPQIDALSAHKWEIVCLNKDLRPGGSVSQYREPLNVLEDIISPLGALL